MNLIPHPWLHPVFEALADVVAYALYRRIRRQNGDPLAEDQRWPIIAAAAIGALVGSRILGLLDQASSLHFTWSTLAMPGGRTTVGGLLGAWIAVAFCKRQRGSYDSTGDLFALPLCLGIAVGRIGCFLSGLADGTEGRPTGLPWGINFGDGIVRHPTPIYEILFLAALAGILHGYNDRPHPNGATFRIFLAAYLAWRVLIDFIKPESLFYGLSLIQWASLVGLLVLLPSIVRLLPIHLRVIRSSQ